MAAQKVLHACVDCGKESWVELNNGEPRTIKCRSCGQKGRHPTEATRLKMRQSAVGKHRGENYRNWKGGRCETAEGYILVKLQSDDFFYPMTNKSGYTPEHRLIMAKSLGRCLHRWEIVHHRNSNRKDNRIENLQLVQEMQHNQVTIMGNRIRFLESRVTLLEAEIVLMRRENNVLISQ